MREPTHDDVDYLEMEDPPLARALLKNTGAAWFWLPIRLYVGYEWLMAGIAHLGDRGWIGDGSALRAFWIDAVLAPTSPAAPTLTDSWYRALLGFLLDAGGEGLIARLVVFCELAVGVALIAGGFVGIAAFLGATLNMSLMIAGTTNGDALVFVGAVGLMLAWRIAGYAGLDRLLLPSIGVPWHHQVLDEKPAGAPHPG